MYQKKLEKSQYSDKIRRVTKLLCENCKHEQCGTSICPIESMTDEDFEELHRLHFGNE